MNGYWNTESKIWNSECLFYKKEVCRKLKTKRYWQKLTKLLALKDIFFLEKKLNFQSREHQRVLRLKDQMLLKISLLKLFFQSVLRATKMFSPKKRTTFIKTLSQGHILALLSLNKFLRDQF